jgi:hypothetical protein
MKFRLLKHVIEQAKERDISIKVVEEIISKPEQVVPDEKGLKVAQNKYMQKNKEYLIRVVFREEEATRIGITAYVTSKVKKYWRQK